jgi:hypothetical protein
MGKMYPRITGITREPNRGATRTGVLPARGCYPHGAIMLGRTVSALIAVVGRGGGEGVTVGFAGANAVEKLLKSFPVRFLADR